jgi:hypothetical protein
MHHAVGGLPPSLMQDTMPPGDTPQQSAVTIIKAVETEAEETYAESIALPTSMRSR